MDELVFGGLSDETLSGLAGVLTLALVPVELFLQVCLSIRCSRESGHGSLELPTTKLAYSNRRSRSHPFHDTQVTLWHEHSFP